MDDATRIEGILGYLEVFEQPDFEFGEWAGSQQTLEMPYYQLSPKSRQFCQALYKHNWIIPFDWGEWQDEAVKYLDDPTLLETANAETISKLFTTHVRKDRFCEGHLAAMFTNGHIVAMLRRLKAIKENEMS